MSSALQQKLEFCFMRRNTQGSLFILLKKAEKILGSALRACKGGRDLKAILLTYFSPTEQCLICLTYITYKTTENKHVHIRLCALGQPVHFCEFLAGGICWKTAELFFWDDLYPLFQYGVNYTICEDSFGSTIVCVLWCQSSSSLLKPVNLHQPLVSAYSLDRLSPCR